MADSPSDPRAQRSILVYRKWLADRIYRTTGQKFDDYRADADAGKIKGLEPGTELEELWNE